jgi:lipoic acid synthetase
MESIQNKKSMSHQEGFRAKPPWLRRRLASGAQLHEVHELIKNTRVHTVCQEARCPNLGECFSGKTATFLILGDRCTRNCGFCAVNHGPPEPLDPEEPLRVARAAEGMKLRYVVVTSVTRDDLPDGGAGLFAETIKAIQRRLEDVRVEVLIPDFQGSKDALSTVLEACPDVLNHNLETVSRLYQQVRPQALYERSLHLLERVKESNPEIPTKSGLMLGLGETAEEIRATFNDLLEAGCGILTLGQYLRPSKAHLPVERFVTPEEFASWRRIALGMGFLGTASGPFVRSSYHARELYLAAKPL